MSNAVKSLFLLLCLLVIVSATLWLREQKRSGTLSGRLEAARDELAAVRAEKSGVEAANEELRRQVRTLREAPPLFTSRPEEGEEPDGDHAFADLESPRETLPAPVEDDAREEPTAEEIAEREEREERRRQWREERERRREAFRERMTEEMATRLEFFARLPTEGLAPEYREAHEQLMINLEHVRNLMNRMDGADLERDERREVMRDLFTTFRETRPLLDMQRDVLLDDYARESLGLDAEGTRDFLDYMRTVERMTSGGPPRGGR